MRILIILFSFFVSTQAVAQPDHLKGMDYDQLAYYYINYLKTGALYVRLHTKSRKIAILENAGNIAAAEKVRKDQFKTNKSIVTAFRKAFVFCPVYFFYSDDSKYILSNDIDSIKFLDDNLQYWKAIDPPKQFLVAEFGIIKQDTMKYFEGNSADYHKDSANVMHPNKQYGGGTNMSFGALIIKSPQLVQLSKPFPYYVRNLATLPFVRRSHFKVVTILNTKLSAFGQHSSTGTSNEIIK